MPLNSCAGKCGTMLPGKLGKRFCADCDPAKKQAPPSAEVETALVRRPPLSSDVETLDSGEEENPDGS